MTRTPLLLSGDHINASVLGDTNCLSSPGSNPPVPNYRADPQVKAPAFPFALLGVSMSRDFHSLGKLWLVRVPSWIYPIPSPARHRNNSSVVFWAEGPCDQFAVCVKSTTLALASLLSLPVFKLILKHTGGKKSQGHRNSGL